MSSVQAGGHKPIIFYDLVTREGGPLFSANTWKTRLSLLHKGVNFVVREITTQDLKLSISPRVGIKRVLVPLIELPDGTFISDSLKIAEYLDKTYPTAPSLFLPSATEFPYDTQSPAMDTAKAFARIINAGLGDSDPGWSYFFELAAAGIAKQCPPGPIKDYFMSDEKLGVKDGWKQMMSLDKDETIKKARLSLIPIQRQLLHAQFLTSSEHPGFVDYVVFGRYAMIRSVDPPLAKAVFEVAGEEGIGEVGKWVERMLDLHDGHARKMLDRPFW